MSSNLWVGLDFSRKSKNWSNLKIKSGKLIKNCLWNSNQYFLNNILKLLGNTKEFFEWIQIFWSNCYIDPEKRIFSYCSCIVYSFWQCFRSVFFSLKEQVSGTFFETVLWSSCLSSMIWTSNFKWLKRVFVKYLWGFRKRVFGKGEQR